MVFGIVFDTCLDAPGQWFCVLGSYAPMILLAVALLFFVNLPPALVISGTAIALYQLWPVSWYVVFGSYGVIMVSLVLHDYRNSPSPYDAVLRNLTKKMADNKRKRYFDVDFPAWRVNTKRLVKHIREHLGNGYAVAVDRGKIRVKVLVGR